jgi:cytochrome c553/ketosteroid isomerase-like protein
MVVIRLILLAVLAVVPKVAMAASPEDAAAAKRTIVDYYAAWAAHDVARYRSLCTDDYLILDNGEMSNRDQDIAYLRAHPEAWRGRTDHFDFRKVTVRGSEAYVVYFLNSEIRTGKTLEDRRYLESAVLRRSAHGWQVFLLHSTRLAATPEKDASNSADAEFRAAMAWAFPLNPPADPGAPKPDMHKALHVPGSTRTYTLADYDDMHGAPDWFPQDHPPMPRIVAHGRGDAWACAYCHLPNGQGRPENAPLAGLPAAYIVEQVNAFRSGARTTGRPETTKFMPAEARNVTDADLKRAAAYFSSLHYRPWTRVVETAIVPKTHIAHWMLVPDADGGREPIGDRIIETSTDVARTELRDTRFGFVAYVPPGSIARGAAIASKGTQAAAACESCHGPDLRGAANVPPLAGRSPTYIVRQLILFRTGGRTNATAAPMRQEASWLSLQDMVSVAAYAASRHP